MTERESSEAIEAQRQCAAHPGISHQGIVQMHQHGLGSISVQHDNRLFTCRTQRRRRIVLQFPNAERLHCRPAAIEVIPLRNSTTFLAWMRRTPNTPFARLLARWRARRPPIEDTAIGVVGLCVLTLCRAVPIVRAPCVGDLGLTCSLLRGVRGSGRHGSRLRRFRAGELLLTAMARSRWNLAFASMAVVGCGWPGSA